MATQNCKKKTKQKKKQQKKNKCENVNFSETIRRAMHQILVSSGSNPWGRMWDDRTNVRDCYLVECPRSAAKVLEF